MHPRSNRICPVERAGHLDNRIRRWLQSPRNILAPYVKVGMTVLDIGCGPGFFTIDMARMVGDSGRVIAADLQAAMLQKLKGKIQGTALEERITLLRCDAHRINVSVKVDFVLAFYMVHEVPHPEDFLRELEAILKPQGQVLIVEPPFRVSKAAFEATLRNAQNVGLESAEGPRVLLSKTALLRKRPSPATA